MRDPALKAELDRMNTSERLRMWAQLGMKVKTWMPGPLPEDSAVFGEVLLRNDLLPVASDADPETVREHVHAVHSCGRWAEFGFNVFDLSLDLAASFLLTDPPETQEELKLPFPCFFIRLPPEVVPMFTHDKQVWAEGIWCHRFTSTHNIHGPRTPFFRWTVEHRSVSLWKDRFPQNLDDPVDQEQYNLTWLGDPPCVPEDEISASRALRIVKNLASWLDATGGLGAHPQPLPPRLKRKASKDRRREVDSGSWPHVWLFGRNVKLRPELRRIAKGFALAQSPRHALPDWSVQVRHVVQGHFKWQAHGVNRTDRKRIWIEPYYRGPEGAAAWAHIYQASEPENP